ncbi:AraC family transcriptional regulator [Lampropedia puyangensis]|uniref:AraC family transcriptional regulator n=1 Tax=Lampropedia puyangensis TaxID=1330072 RepID=A0A4S8EN84_9BURK|nr:AraC family transcriptional regulator [Lampropedia puyangensis]THT96167.1 AraC family transcriptional regulator [Lampropedia puyangensis]
MDTLSEVLSMCRSEQAVTARFVLGQPWALSSQGVPGTMLRVAQGAPYWMAVGKEPAQQVFPGDVVLLPQGSAHVMGSAVGVAPVPFSQLIQKWSLGPKDTNPLVFEHGGRGVGTCVSSVMLWVNAQSRHALLRLLPPLVIVRTKEQPLLAVLGATLEQVVAASVARQPGWRLAAGRMGEVLLIEVLRLRLGHMLPNERSWMQGLSDPQIAQALLAMHRQPDAAWSVQSLAQQVAMSRSAFAMRFKELVGQTPIAYLTHQRMTRAAEQLEAGTVALFAVAEQAGYDSDRVFARAFKRWSGLPPSVYQRRAERNKRHYSSLETGVQDAT